MLGEAQGSKTCHSMVGACTCVSIKRCQLCGPQPALAGEVSCLYPLEFLQWDTEFHTFTQLFQQYHLELHAATHLFLWWVSGF